MVGGNKEDSVTDPKGVGGRVRASASIFAREEEEEEGDECKVFGGILCGCLVGVYLVKVQ